MKPAKIQSSNEELNRAQDQLHKALDNKADKFIERLAAQPEASAKWLGRVIRVRSGNGVSERLYVCLQGSDDTYQWCQMATAT